MNPFLFTLTLATTCFALSGCQSLTSTHPSSNQIKFEHTAPNCKGERCAFINVESIRFPDNAALTHIVEKRLLDMAQEPIRNEFGDIPKSADLRSYERNFLERSPNGYATYLQAEVIEQRPDWIVIELSSYLERGGAHGMPGRGFINYDLQQNRETSLNDWLIPGQEEAFWQVAQGAHQRWLTEKELTSDPASLENYLKQWPFTKTNNIALTRNELLLKYDVYTLAPYSSGHPQLKIPYSELKGILRNEVIPR